MPLLKKIHDNVRLKSVQLNLDKPVKYWEIIIYADETKFELFGCHNTQRVWRSKEI